MDGTRPGEPLTDSALAREVESALGIEPSPEFLARVRTRIANEPEPSPWRLADAVSGFSRTGVVSGFSRTCQRWAVEPLAGLAIVGIVLALVVPRLMRDEVPIVQVKRGPTLEVQLKPDATISRNRVEADLPASAEATADKRVDLDRPMRRVTRAPVARTTPLRLSQPLFSDDERQALIVLVTAVEQGRMPPMPAASEAGDQSVDSGPQIAPLVIDPLPLLARAPQQGEDQW
jgi:hypothetical protein